MRLFSVAAVAAGLCLMAESASAQVYLRPVPVAPVVVVPPPTFIQPGGISLGYYSPGLNITVGRPAFYAPPFYGYGVPAYSYYRPGFAPYPHHYHHCR